MVTLRCNTLQGRKSQLSNKSDVTDFIRTLKGGGSVFHFSNCCFCVFIDFEYFFCFETIKGKPNIEIKMNQTYLIDFNFCSSGLET